MFGFPSAHRQSSLRFLTTFVVVGICPTSWSETSVRRWWVLHHICDYYTSASYISSLLVRGLVAGLPFSSGCMSWTPVSRKLQGHFYEHCLVEPCPGLITQADQDRAQCPPCLQRSQEQGLQMSLLLKCVRVLWVVDKRIGLSFKFAAFSFI